MKLIALTDHARVVMAERALEFAWVERAAREPDWTEPEPRDPSLELRFRAVPERADAFCVWSVPKMMLQLLL